MALPCARCMTVAPAEAKYCTGCGAPIAAVHAVLPASPPALVERTVAATNPSGPYACRGCGIQQASRRDTCEVCDTAHTEGSVAIPRDDDTYWVGVRCRFQCRSCGHLSPLDHLDMDGSVTCLRCGLDQIFEVSSWRDGLDHAMRAGLLAGSAGDFARLGETKSTIEHAQSGMTIANGMITTISLRVAAGPGHPLCPACRVPLTVEVEGNVATSRCPTCSAGMRCTLPGPAPKACAAVRAVLAEELATDRRDARIESRGEGKPAGAVAITCPHCSAPLRVTGSATIVTCEYCKASSRIPRRTLFQLGHDHPVPQVWWLQFSTAAARRAIGRTKATPAPAPASVTTPRVPAPARPPVRPKPPAAAGIAVAVAVVALVGVIGFGADIQRWRSATASPGPAAAADAGVARAPSSPTTTAAASRPRGHELPYLPLGGCTCGTVQLHAQTTPVAGGTTGMTIRLRADRKRHDPLELVALETEHRTLGIAIACTGDRLVIAAGNEAWAFSLSTRSLAWQIELPAPYRYAATVPDAGISMTCRRLSITGRSVSVPTGPRGSTRVGLETGAISRGR